MPLPAAQPRVLIWHVHGAWTSAFVRGTHRCLVPVTAVGGAWGRGRCGRDWPVDEVSPAQLSSGEAKPDLVVLQRPEELALTEVLLGKRPGVDVPAVYVEHNAPHGPACGTRHPLADHPAGAGGAIPLVHVTPFNELMWDNGDCRTVVIEHGIPDPGYLYEGGLPRAVTMINEPVRRGRVVGTDLLPLLQSVPIDVFGMGSEQLGPMGRGDVRYDRLHQEVGKRRAYVHTARWTSLGLSLIEAMTIGMPVVVLASTEAASLVPPEAGVTSTRPPVLACALADFVADPEHARLVGKAARQFALHRFGLDRFLHDWSRLLHEVWAA